MAEAIRRVLWSVPLLGVLTIALFSLLSRLESAQSQLKAPLFYNSSPTSAGRASERAVADLLSGVPGASQRLVVLGGAALPHILESLPTRPIQKRRRLADALWPVAVRMGFSSDDVWVARGHGLTKHDIPTADEKLVFWEQFGEEHATDLTPLAVQRLVKRVATRDAQLRERELKAVDTYALPFLVEALGRVRDQEDVKRCRRLIKYVAHATGGNFTIPAEATIDDVRREVTRVRRFWDEHGPQWTERSPFEMVVARVLQTEYTKWLTRTIRELTRLDHSQITDDILLGLPISGLLLAAALGGLFVLAPIVSSAIQVMLLRAGHYRIERFGLRLVLAAALVSASAWSIRRSHSSVHELVIVALLTGGTFGTFVLQRELGDRLDWRTHHVLKSRGPLAQVIAISRWIAPAVPTLLPMALVEAATYVTCLESASGLPGVGAKAVEALLSGDLAYLMTFCMGLGLLTVALQLLSDLALGDFDASQTGGRP